MKKLLITIVFGLFTFLSFAQGSKYENQYNMIVSKLGYDGVGVETVLKSWEQADSANIKMLIAKFNYYFTKCQSTEVVLKDQKKFLGKDAVLELKDSIGKPVYYHQEVFYEDEYYSQALKAVERIKLFYPQRFDIRLTEIFSLIAYEKDSPDMAHAKVLELIEEFPTRASGWEMPETKVDNEFFESAIQELCYTFYNIGTPSAYKSFNSVSKRMLELNKKNYTFLSNTGVYELVVNKNYKAALKIFTKVLKLNKEDVGAIKNIIIISRKTKNIKLEKKYLPLLVKYGSKADQISAKARLEALEKLK